MIRDQGLTETTQVEEVTRTARLNHAYKMLGWWPPREESNACRPVCGRAWEENGEGAE
jgi:hypothetical protein